MATLTWLTQSHFRPMVHTLSLAHQMIRCGCGKVWNLTTLESRPKIPPMASHTPDGFFPQMHKRTSCLSHLMHGCLTLPTSLLYHPPLSPTLISPMRPLVLDGMIVTVHSFPIPLYSTPHILLVFCIIDILSCACVLLVFSLFSILLCHLFFLEIQ